MTTDTTSSDLHLMQSCALLGLFAILEQSFGMSSHRAALVREAFDGELDMDDCASVTKVERHSGFTWTTTLTAMDTGPNQENCQWDVRWQIEFTDERLGQGHYFSDRCGAAWLQWEYPPGDSGEGARLNLNNGRSSSGTISEAQLLATHSALRQAAVIYTTTKDWDTGHLGHWLV
ncbi:hypothetical protein JNJ66_04125 [Candidatus Saccharibacteria bacterium]|nr:hypothetical protein [Candidatus Saccharibacteria bacterium]